MMETFRHLLQLLAIVGVISSSLYYILCLFAAAKFHRECKAQRLGCLTACPEPAEGSRRLCDAWDSGQSLPGVSILKPLKGIDPEIYASFRSHCLQDYPDYEIIFGVSDPNDPAIASVKKLQQEFPGRQIQLLVVPTILGPNVKVSNLAQMLPRARYDFLLINDSDIRVEPDYLRRVIAPLADPAIGMVTCLYRGVPGATLGSRLEALGIATDFCPGVLAARQLEGGIRFGLGSTLAFRRADLEKIGGFAPLLDYLADDYELGTRIAGLGLKIHLSDVVVETHLPSYRLPDFVAHQLRWARGIRDARRGGYFGLIFTFGLMWALFALLAGAGARWTWCTLAITLILRFSVALFVGGSILQDRSATKNFWLIPLRDLIAVTIWIASLFGRTVTWRGDQFILMRGKLKRMPP